MLKVKVKIRNEKLKEEIDQRNTAVLNDDVMELDASKLNNSC
jgi:hypothetical protein